MGGDCLNVGCVPSKALISASRVAHTVRNSEAYGVEVTGYVTVNFGKVIGSLVESSSLALVYVEQNSE